MKPAGAEYLRRAWRPGSGSSAPRHRGHVPRRTLRLRTHSRPHADGPPSVARLDANFPMHRDRTAQSRQRRSAARGVRAAGRQQRQLPAAGAQARRRRPCVAGSLRQGLRGLRHRRGEAVIQEDATQSMPPCDLWVSANGPPGFRRYKPARRATATSMGAVGAGAVRRTALARPSPPWRRSATPCRSGPPHELAADRGVAGPIASARTLARIGEGRRPALSPNGVRHQAWLPPFQPHTLLREARLATRRPSATTGPFKKALGFFVRRTGPLVRPATGSQQGTERAMGDAAKAVSPENGCTLVVFAGPYG